MKMSNNKSINSNNEFKEDKIMKNAVNNQSSNGKHTTIKGGATMKNVYETLEKNIVDADLPEKDKNKMLKNLMKLKNDKVGIMITGATGCGKSSTINALFDMEVAKVGVGVDPETMEIEKYELNNLELWDSPGLGDGKEADNRHAKNIIKKLSEVDEKGNAVIDLVLVILDGGSRDLGTSYELINQVIIPNLGDNSRILVAINQADVAMKGRYWNYETNKPEPKLVAFLEEKAKSVKERIYEATGVEVDPIYYSAGYKEEGEEQCRPYNLSKLLYYIVKMTPDGKRHVYANDNVNQREEMWQDDDEIIDYGKETRKSILESVVAGASKGADIGEEIGGCLFGTVGEKVGRVAGGIVGGAVEFVKSIGEIIGIGRSSGGIFGGGGFFGW